MSPKQSKKSGERETEGTPGKEARQVNKLGFGLLRLPQTGKPGKEDMDWKELEAMVDEFISRGGRYFDTAYTYLDGASEDAFRRAVAERYPRRAYEIADKLPSWLVKSPEECGRYFEEQCNRCGVQRFDVYLLHWLNRENYCIACRLCEKNCPQGIEISGWMKKIADSME